MFFFVEFCFNKGTMSQNPMLTPARRKALGSVYSLVGTHSAVKLCRWHKSMMQGRGGCYKWTFLRHPVSSVHGVLVQYQLCKTSAPFCWRLNSNPVASAWRWDVDEPAKLVDGMLSSQKALVRNAGGIPDVTTTRRE